MKKICVLAMNPSTIFSSIFARELNQYICNVFIRICLKIQKMLSTRVHPIQTSLVAIGIHGPSVWRYRGTMLVTGPDTSQVSWRAPLWQEIKKSKFAVLQVFRYLRSEPHSSLFITEQKGGDISKWSESGHCSPFAYDAFQWSGTHSGLHHNITTEEARARCLEWWEQRANAAVRKRLGSYTRTALTFCQS